MALINIPTTGLWSTVAGYLNSNFTYLNKASFMAVSTTEVTISTDSTAATFIPDLYLENNSGDFEVESSVGGVRNISGKTLEVLIGIVSYHVGSTNASSKELYIFSEVSIDDGVTWTKNELSAREESISGTSIRYGTKSSETFDLVDDAIIRFRFYGDGSGMTISPVAFLADGETLSGPSFRWRLNEV